MASTPEAVLKDLKANKYAPVYFLQGEEPYYIDKIADYIEKNALPEGEKSFNQTVLYGKEHNVSQIVQRARQFPMMSERVVILVKEAQEVSDFGKEAADKLLDAYIQNPLPSTVLVFCYKNKKLDARKSITKVIDKHAVLVTSEKVKDYKLAEWVEQYFHSQGLKATSKAMVMIADYIGNDLARITNEIDKLLVNLKSGAEINEDIVEKYVGISKEFNVFELQKALLQKDLYKANLIVNYFEANSKANPVILTISSLFGYFSKILLVHGEQDRSDANLGRVLGLPPFVAKEYANAVRVFPLIKTISIINYLRESDLLSKGVDAGDRTDGQILKELVYKIMH